MKRFILAIAIALCTIAAPVAETSAASVTFSDNGVTVRDNGYDGYRHHRRHFRDNYYYGRHHRRPHCRVRTVKTYRHHRVIIRKVRICR